MGSPLEHRNSTGKLCKDGSQYLEGKQDISHVNYWAINIVGGFNSHVYPISPSLIFNFYVSLVGSLNVSSIVTLPLYFLSPFAHLDVQSLTGIQEHSFKE